MRYAPLTILACGMLATPSVALEYAGSCRGPTATVIEIEGLDTARARMTAHHTLPDAISYCHFTLGREAGKKSPSIPALQTCAQAFLKEAAKSGPITATANCKIGTLGTAGTNWSNAYQLPIAPMCGGDNNQAISLFHVLCPSYEGKIEEY